MSGILKIEIFEHAAVFLTKVTNLDEMKKPNKEYKNSQVAIKG